MKPYLQLLVASIILLCFSNCQKPEALTAIFNVESVQVFEGQTIDFNDISYGNPTSWEWTFLGGTPSNSTDQNPKNIQYDVPGTYGVTLTVTDEDGSDSKTITEYIQVIHTGSTQTLLNDGHKISKILTVKPVDSLYGKHYGGGLIFYVNDYLESRVMIAAISDVNDGQTNGAAWGCIGTDCTYSEGTLIGSGELNTPNIISSCSEPNIAAKLCAEYSSGGYDDWFLPSISEISELHRNLWWITPGSFANYYYWTSSEEDANQATALLFNVNKVFGDFDKDNIMRVRPVRMIDLE